MTSELARLEAALNAEETSLHRDAARMGEHLMTLEQRGQALRARDATLSWAWPRPPDAAALFADAVRAREAAVKERQSAHAAARKALDGLQRQLEALQRQLTADAAAIDEARRRPAQPPPPPPNVTPVPQRAPQAAPPGLTPSSRRQAPRVKLQAAIDLSSDANFFQGFSDNISEGGLFVATLAEVPLGTEVDLAFTLPTGERIEATGVVRWQRENNDKLPDVFPGVGVQFSSIDEPARRAIERFVAERDPLFYAAA